MREQPSSLMERFNQVYAMLHRFHSFSFLTQGPTGNPHRGQGRVLSILKLQPQISQKELGYLLDMRNQSLGELLAKLEKKGYIIRTPSEQDRRTMNIHLTEAGQEAAGQAEQNRDDADRLFGCLTEEERVQLEALLDRLADGLEAQLLQLLEQAQQEGGHQPPPPPMPPHAPRDHSHRFFDRFGGSPFGPRDGRPPFGRGWDEGDDGDKDE